MPLLCETRLLEDLIVEMKNPNKKWECVGFAALTQFALGVTVAGLRNTSVTAFPRGNIFFFFRIYYSIVMYQLGLILFGQTLEYLINHSKK